MPSFGISIAGSVNTGDPDHNPFVQLRTPAAQELLSRVARAPQPVHAVEPDLLARLVTLEALRVEDGLCYVNFPCLLADDVALLAAVGEEFAARLAALVASELADAGSLAAQCSYPAPGADKIMLILVGCVALDWGGLRLLADGGYCTAAPLKPGNNHYVLFGDETASVVTGAGVYCSSNTSGFGRYAFTSFGGGPRHCFPDLFWRLTGGPGARLKPSYAAPLYASLGERDVGEWAELLAQVLAGVERDEAAAALLESLAYTRNGALNVPLFVAADRHVAEEVKARVSRAVGRWVEAEYEPLRAQLAGLSPNRWGVPYGETFNRVWHAVFGRANGILAEQGIFYDPCGAGGEFEGCLPTVFEQAAQL